MDKKLNQSIWSTVIIYSGILIGFINSIFLFPKFLSTEQIGLIRQIISAVFILIPITTFGSGTTYTKFYPSFQKNYKQKNEFLSFQLFTIILSFCIIFLVINIFLNDIKNLFTEKSNLLFEYQNLFFSLLFVLSLSSLFESYLRARYNTVLSNYVNGVSNRFLTSITILLLSLTFIDFNVL